ncbi:hypothetical protein SK128_006589 [Halocaridina rubra]|uniref:Uncharacterized protein n=1 Tax=Halocaridina rubra TaxID=373956 RepID=A0AAN8XDW1_HALRR
MATTVTVGVGVGAAAVAAALAGAIGLGLAGLAVASQGGRKRGKKQSGYGGGQNSEYKGSSSYEHRRKKRSPQEEAEDMENVLDLSGDGSQYSGVSGYGHRRKKRSPEQEAEALENVLELIRQEDVSGCGLRLICQLGELPEEELTIEELSMLQLVGPPIQIEDSIPSNKASWDYRVARTIGYSGGDCGEAYPKCPLAGKQLINAVMEYIP